MTDHLADYSIEEHKHRFAMWCAARAYGRGLDGGGNEFAFELIREVGLGEVRGPSDIGADVDEWLLGYMRRMVALAKGKGRNEFTFGHAQKLVNIYFKGVLVCGGHHEDALVAKLHPPLDSVLFETLRTYLFRNRSRFAAARAAFLDAQRANRRWTDFDEAQYMQHIAVMKILAGGEPLYSVEKHWQL